MTRRMTHDLNLWKTCAETQVCHRELELQQGIARFRGAWAWACAQL